MLCSASCGAYVLVDGKKSSNKGIMVKSIILKIPPVMWPELNSSFHGRCYETPGVLSHCSRGNPRRQCPTARTFCLIEFRTSPVFGEWSHKSHGGRREILSCGELSLRPETLPTEGCSHDHESWGAVTRPL